VLKALDWQGPVYEISAIKGVGTDTLCADMMTYLEERRALEAAEPELAEAEHAMQMAMQEEARKRIADLRAEFRREARENREHRGGDDDDDDFDDDDYDVEVEYAP